MSDNDTVEGAAQEAAPEEQNDEAIWQRELERRKNPEPDVDDQDDDAAPDDAEDGTDDEVDAKASEPDESKSSEGKAPKEQEKPAPVNVDRLKGTISGLNRKISEQQREIAAFAKRKKDEGNDDITDLESLKAEYPEVVGPLIDRLTRLEANLGDQRSQLSKMSELADLQYNTSAKSEEARLDEMLPDWERTINADRKRFDAWVSDSDTPRWVYGAYKENKVRVTDADATAKLVTAFKQHIGAETRPQSASTEAPPKRSPSRRLDGARATTSRGPQVHSENDNGLTEEQIWEREAKKRLRMRQQAG